MEFLAGFATEWHNHNHFRGELVDRFARIFSDYRTLDEGV